MIRSILLVVCMVAPLGAQGPGTRLLSDPGIGPGALAFVYDGDVWVVRQGAEARRLTTHKGTEGRPRISPDGKTVVFHAQYDGNTDVYAVPIEGGAPRRLTYHPGRDLVQGFTPDGGAVLFTSGRSVYTRRFMQLFTIPLEGGQPTRLPVPNAFRATYSPDGKHIAYNPLSEPFRQWKNYRGGTASRIWVYDTSDHSVVQVPQPEGRCNDAEPMWVEKDVCFLSDRDGEFKVMAWTPGAEEVRRLTEDSPFPVVHASAGAGKIVFERAGWLYELDPATKKSVQRPIRVRSDLIETRPRWVDGARWIRNADVSPSGKRAVFEFRGEIVTVPAKKGDPRNLTNTPGAHERSPVWSPKGDRIAWFSDVNGEYAVHVAPQDGTGKPKVYELGGAGHYDRLRWAPDGSKLSFADNAWSLFWLDVEKGKVTKVSSEPVYGPMKTIDVDWSPDSRWIAYTRLTRTFHNQVFIYDTQTGKSRAVTAGLADVRHPTFDANGKLLYFAGSTDAGPVRTWFAQSNADMRMTQRIYVAVLQKGEPSPLAPESDEEPAPDKKEKSEKKGDGKEEKKAKEKSKDEKAVGIDFDGLDQRILALPVPSGTYADLARGAKNHLYYRRTPQEGSAALYRYDLEARKEEKVASDVRGFRVAAGKKKLLLRTGSSNWSIVKAGPGAKGGRLDVSAIRVRIEPRVEWRQIFDEAWRINRDWFYDPGMHGADWKAMRDRYAPFLPHCATRSDLNRVIRWMCSEIAVGHHRVGGGDRLHDPDRVGGGLLGADFDIANERYRFQRVLGGLNWDARLRAPLTVPGVDVQAGEYLLAVDGRPIRPPENLHARFENTAGRQVRLTVGKDPSGAGSREVTVVPISNEGALRNRAWIQGNVERVHQATNGRVAYVYVPNTAGSGHRSFKRWFFPQADKEAVIVDERFNAGGQVADYVIDILRRPHTCWWATRYGEDLTTPLASVQGPKVMLIDETAGSGGDLLPWMFRQAKLGTLIGRRTWGGLVGVLGFPTLMDGGSVTAPNIAIWTPEGFIVENVGVPPDIEVEQLPKDVIAGKDPQLERAIAEIMKQLPKEPAKGPARPPFPKRAR